MIGHLSKKLARVQFAKRDPTTFHSAVLPDGSIKHIHSVGKPFFEESGGVTEYIGVSMDVTNANVTRLALQLAQAELARVRG
jgi:hypothetical protein